MLTEIVNHLWQSTLVAAAIAVLAALLRNDGAHVRYWLWWAASAKFLVPFSLLMLLGGALRDAGAPRFELGEWPAAPRCVRRRGCSSPRSSASCGPCCSCRATSPSI